MSTKRGLGYSGWLTGKPPPLWLCIHEAGHAVAHLVLDELPPYPGPFIRSVSVIQADDYLGCVKTQPRVMMIPEILAMTDRVLNQQQRRYQYLHATYDVVEYLAGFVAEISQKQGWYGPLMMGRDVCVYALPRLKCSRVATCCLI